MLLQLLRQRHRKGRCPYRILFGELVPYIFSEGFLFLFVAEAGQLRLTSEAEEFGALDVLGVFANFGELMVEGFESFLVLELCEEGFVSFLFVAFGFGEFFFLFEEFGLVGGVFSLVIHFFFFFFFFFIAAVDHKPLGKVTQPLPAHRPFPLLDRLVPPNLDAQRLPDRLLMKFPVRTVRLPRMRHLHGDGGTGRRSKAGLGSKPLVGKGCRFRRGGHVAVAVVVVVDGGGGRDGSDDHGGGAGRSGRSRRSHDDGRTGLAVLRGAGGRIVPQIEIGLGNAPLGAQSVQTLHDPLGLQFLRPPFGQSGEFGGVSAVLGEETVDLAHVFFGGGVFPLASFFLGQRRGRRCTVGGGSAPFLGAMTIPDRPLLPVGVDDEEIFVLDGVHLGVLAVLDHGLFELEVGQVGAAFGPEGGALFGFFSHGEFGLVVFGCVWFC
mmetsp:Transcript_23/g.44  ORF Transcript_23/g.44 Transcript_23/m.44 type:complete len:436 (+) Transcript_23:408-1715(+)